MACTLYEVRLQVDPIIAPEFEIWLKDHVQQMLEIEGFLSASIWKEELSNEPAAPIVWVCHYSLKNRSSLEDYFMHHAGRMRADGLQRFGDRFKASRRVMTEIQSYRL